MDEIKFMHRDRQIRVKRGPDYVRVASYFRDPADRELWILQMDGMLDSYSLSEAGKFARALLAAVEADG